LTTRLAIELRGRAGELSLDVSLAVDGVVALVGPNGAGKTTLLKLVLGVAPSTGGRVSLGDTVLYDAAQGVDLPPEERALGWVPQHYGLFPHLSVEQNVAFGARTPADAARELERLGLEALRARRPGTLSGGERQRVALARALAAGPRALLLDEPLAALDASARRQLRASLAELLHEVGLPALIVTHDPDDAAALADKVAVLDGGKVVQTGTLEELRSGPKTEFVAELFRRDGASPRPTAAGSPGSSGGTGTSGSR
jgi:molybdate transport system ATP-binding protein